MANHNPADSSPTFEPSSNIRKRTTRARSIRAMQDELPHQATARRDPRRAELALERASACAQIADDNRGRDILVLDLRQSTPIVDFFVIVTAVSRRQSRAMASEIDQAMKKLGETKLGIEGVEDGRWTLIDYGDFVVHVFSPDDRAYYALEEIWGDAPKVNWQAPPSQHSALAGNP
jgi:ribosome-associated protein